MNQRLTSFMAHAAGWICFFSLVMGFANSSSAYPNLLSSILSRPFLLFCVTYLLIFYLNLYLLLPELYMKRRQWLYIFSLVILAVLVFYIRPFDGLMRHFPHPGHFIDPIPHTGTPTTPMTEPGHFRRRPNIDMVSLVLFIAVWSLSSAIYIIEQWRITRQRAAQAEADKARAELSFLKAQVNPHFLFNTLNNIYSLAVTGNQNTAASILKLSNIMRYVTDDITQDFVELDDEIACIRDYIDLQRMRLGETMSVDMAIEGETTGKQIAPLILMTFVENVFKYGTSNHEYSDILIKLITGPKRIHFFCVNKLFDKPRQPERTGVGIANTRQRLQHLYPGRHKLDINTDNGFYTVQLDLEL